MKRRLAILLISSAPVFATAQTTGSSSSTGKLLTSLFQGCWTCGAFNTVAAIGLGFANTAFSKIASGLTILIGLFMALWVLYFAAKLFLPFGPPGASHWNMGAEKLFKLIAVLAFLGASDPFWEYIFVPVVSTGMGLASQMATATDQYEALFVSTSGGTTSAPTGTTDYCSDSPPAPPITGLSASAQKGLTALEQMDCPLSKMQGEFGKGMLIGVATMGQMACSKSWTLQLLPANGAIAALVAGLILVAVYLWGYLVFPFLLIDVIARVILVAAISPLAIASVLFKSTEHIAVRCMWSLAHAGLALMFGATVAGIGKALIAYILLQMAATGGPPVTDWTSLEAALENSCQVNFNVDFSTAGFYMLVGTAIITIFMMRRASSLAAEITHVSGGTGAQAGMAAIVGAAGGAAGRAGRLLVKKVSGL